MTEDQQRALALGGVGIAALLVVSRMRGRTSAAPPQPTTGQVAPYTPQAPVVVAAGESIYDPNNQALLTTPAPTPQSDLPWVGSGSNVPGTGAQTTAPAAPAYQVNVTYPVQHRRVSHAKRATKRKPSRQPKSKHKAGAKK